MSTVLQISDTHFGTERPPVVEALVRLTGQQQPDLVVLSGDITQRARATEFRSARAFVDRLGVPVLAIPGNHDIPLFDIWMRLRAPYARYSDAFGSDLEPVHVSRDLVVVCVNTTRSWRHKHGEISSDQIDRVAALFGDAGDTQLRVVVVHQPVAVTRAEDVQNQLRGHTAALRQWSTAGVDLVLGGHIHLPYVLEVHDLARPMWAVQAGTAVSSRVRRGAPNSVNLLRWRVETSQRTCQIEQWDYSDAEQAFVCGAVTKVCPARG